MECNLWEVLQNDAWEEKRQQMILSVQINAIVKFKVK